MERLKKNKKSTQAVKYLLLAAKQYFGELMKYMAKGSYVNKGETENFEKNVEAQNEKLAKEKVYAELGSKQGLKRMYILIKEIKAM